MHLFFLGISAHFIPFSVHRCVLGGNTAAVTLWPLACTRLGSFLKKTSSVPHKIPGLFKKEVDDPTNARSAFQIRNVINAAPLWHLHPKHFLGFGYFFYFSLIPRPCKHTHVCMYMCANPSDALQGLFVFSPAEDRGYRIIAPACSEGEQKHVHFLSQGLSPCFDAYRRAGNIWRPRKTHVRTQAAHLY